MVVVDDDGKVIETNAAFSRSRSRGLAGAARGQAAGQLAGGRAQAVRSPGPDGQSPRARDRAPLLLDHAATISAAPSPSRFSATRIQGRARLGVRPSPFARACATRRARPPCRSVLPTAASQFTDLVGRVPLKDLVRDTADIIEKLCIEAALETHRQQPRQVRPPTCVRRSRARASSIKLRPLRRRSTEVEATDAND